MSTPSVPKLNADALTKVRFLFSVEMKDELKEMDNFAHGYGQRRGSVLFLVLAYGAS